MAHSSDTHVAGDTTESEAWEHFVTVIRLNNLTNFEDGVLILVVGADLVERTWDGNLTIGSCVVNSDRHGHLPA